MTDIDPEALVITTEAHLPDFEGTTPVAVITRITGSGQRIHRALHPGEKVTLVITAEVSSIAHTQTNEGMKRVQTLGANELYELEGRRGDRLTRTLAKAYRLAEDGRHGRTGLPDFDRLEGDGDGIEVTTDGSGVVLTDADLADLGITDASTDPAVIIWDDGTRALWPDDFGAHPWPCPDAGDRVPPPGVAGADPVLVRQVLDNLTGETLDEWTDEAEEVRLLEAEHEAEVAEAREDRAVADALVASRPPFDGYDDWSAAALTSRLVISVIDPDEVRQVIVYEGAHKGRSTVISTAQRRLRTLLDRGGDETVSDPEDQPFLPGEEEE